MDSAEVTETAEDVSPFRIDEDGVPWIGDQSYPWAVKVRKDDRPDYSWRSRGFWLLFENGWTLSVQFGTGNYCANRDFGFGEDDWHEECPTAEVAAWWGEGDMVKWEGSGDTVLGWQTGEQVLAHIADVSTRPSRG